MSQLQAPPALVDVWSAPKAPDPGRRAPWPQDLPPPQALSGDLVARSEACCLVDAVVPGQPLLVSFGAVQAHPGPRFDFYGCSKKLEQLSRRPHNRVLLRDPLDAWYQRGVPGLGGTVAETAEALARRVRAVAPSRVVMIGQSMGAYAALMFGALIGADRVVAFSPLSSLDLDFHRDIGDGRWLAVMQALRARPAPGACLDLPALWRETKHKPELRIHYGLSRGASRPQDCNLDAHHALRLAGLPRCEAKAHAGAPHTLVQFLRERRRLDALLMKDVLDLPFPCAAPPPARPAPQPL